MNRILKIICNLLTAKQKDGQFEKIKSSRFLYYAQSSDKISERVDAHWSGEFLLIVLLFP